MQQNYLDFLKQEIALSKEQGLFKQERVITSRQSGSVHAQGKQVINLCANNYLGLAGNQELADYAGQALQESGYGMASVRFICGTQSVHKELEGKLSEFLRKEDAILYSSCFDANTGLFETLLGPEDAIISDALNHASIIDGVRLCKAKRFRYANNDMDALRNCLKEAQGARFKLICTDGVFSMDGIIANLAGICELAEKHNAMVMVDDSHAVGFVGPQGRGTPAFCGVEDRVDIITGTLGKALGGASGGYTVGPKEIIEWLRQRSRPYLFSNTLAPVIAKTSFYVLDKVANDEQLRARLWQNTEYFRTQMEKAGFDLAGKDHPIIPVMTYDAVLAQTMAQKLLEKGVYVIGFFYPVVPKDKARIRTQMSAAHSKEELEQAIEAFWEVGRELQLLK